MVNWIEEWNLTKDIFARKKNEIFKHSHATIKTHIMHQSDFNTPRDNFSDIIHSNQNDYYESPSHGIPSSM
jgi:hypothetical protein